MRIADIILTLWIWDEIPDSIAGVASSLNRNTQIGLIRIVADHGRMPGPAHKLRRIGWR